MFVTSLGSRWLEESSRMMPKNPTKKQVIYLERYLKLCDRFCDIESETKKNKRNSASHHVLPRSIYPEYTKKEKDAKWNFNEVYLTHRAHHIAHKLLAIATGSDAMRKPLGMLKSEADTAEYIIALEKKVAMLESQLAK